MAETGNRERTLFTALLDARATHGGGAEILEDTERKPLTYDRLVLASLILGRRLADATRPGEIVGLLLPNAAGAAAAFFGLAAFGRVPAMLNYTTGAAGMEAACRAAGITTVLTSRLFIERAHLGEAAEALGASVRLVPLEEVRAGIGWREKAAGILDRARARAVHARFGGAPADPAVVLFTSGSEGAPKGVVLTHRNLVANCLQAASRIDFNPRDRVFNALPIFHSFGLTGGLLLPLLSGVRCFVYPSPLHYRIIAELVYGTNATIMFGTDTFLAGYARVAHPYDFYRIRYVFAGAEKVREETRRIWMERFGVRLLEGYGATECSPVIALNTPMHNKPGTVGRLLPGIEHRLEPVEGIAEGGRLFVRGPNVMAGYLEVANPGVVRHLPEGWHDTGDIVAIDDHGFVSILGRAKRFAKIAGEMVSLAAVEDLAARAWPEARHAAVALPDPRRGQQVVLVTDAAGASRAGMQEAARAAGHPELFVPREVIVVDAVPALATGKPDLRQVEALLAAGGQRREAAHGS
jgi:acyl-[acyl-carrier-protein]-phospholipid O-acyltransferase/long-chain-fatty-acid--[acyl-carrier-protein] ligase